MAYVFEALNLATRLLGTLGHYRPGLFLRSLKLGAGACAR